MSREEDLLRQMSDDELSALMSQIEGPQATEFDFGEDVGYFGQPEVSFYETKGGVDPLSRTEEAGRVNLLQDYGALSLDNILSAYAGPGSYDIDAFTPTYEFGEPLNLKGRRKAEGYSGGGGWQGFLSDLIFKEGLNPDEAQAELFERIGESDEGLSTKDAAMKESLRKSMAPLLTRGDEFPTRGGGAKLATETPTGEMYDVDKIYSFANDIYTGLMDDPEFAHEQDGMFYGKTPEEALQKTPQMEFFDKYGIPYPTMSYEDPKYSDAFAQEFGGPAPEEREEVYGAWDEEEKARAEAIEAARTGSLAAGGAHTDLMRAWNNREDLPLSTRGALHDFGGGGGGAPQPTAPPSPLRINPSTGTLLPTPGSVNAAGQRRQPVTEGEQQYESKLPIMTTLNKAGDRVVFDFSKGIDEPGKWSNEIGRKMGLTKTRKLEPLKKGQLREQQQRRAGLKTQANKLGRERRAEAWNDPHLAEIYAYGRALALGQQGRTPFLDAMSARNANSRAMLSGR